MLYYYSIDNAYDDDVIEKFKRELPFLDADPVMRAFYIEHREPHHHQPLQQPKGTWGKRELIDKFAHHE